MSRRISRKSQVATVGDVENIVEDRVERIVTNIVTKAIDNFAVIVNRGFTDVQMQINEMRTDIGRMVTKADFEPFKKETEQSLYELKSDVGEVKVRLENVENRIESVEGKVDIISEIHFNHETRIIRLEGARV